MTAYTGPAIAIAAVALFVGYAAVRLSRVERNAERARRQRSIAEAQAYRRDAAQGTRIYRIRYVYRADASGQDAIATVNEVQRYLAAHR